VNCEKATARLFMRAAGAVFAQVRHNSSNVEPRPSACLYSIRAERQVTVTGSAFTRPSKANENFKTTTDGEGKHSMLVY